MFDHLNLTRLQGEHTITAKNHLTGKDNETMF